MSRREIITSLFAAEPLRNQPSTSCFHNFAMILTTHTNVSASRHHKGDIAESDRALDQEIDLASVTHPQSSKLQANA